MATLELREDFINQYGGVSGFKSAETLGIGQEITKEFGEVPLSIIPQDTDLQTDFGPLAITPSKDPRLNNAPVIANARIVVVDGQTMQIEQRFEHQAYNECTRVLRMEIAKVWDLRRGVVVQIQQDEEGRIIRSLLRLKDDFADPVLKPENRGISPAPSIPDFSI